MNSLWLLRRLKALGKIHFHAAVAEFECLWREQAGTVMLMIVLLTFIQYKHLIICGLKMYRRISNKKIFVPDI